MPMFSPDCVAPQGQRNLDTTVTHFADDFGNRVVLGLTFDQDQATAAVLQLHFHSEAAIISHNGSTVSSTHLWDSLGSNIPTLHIWVGMIWNDLLWIALSVCATI